MWSPRNVSWLSRWVHRGGPSELVGISIEPTGFALAHASLGEAGVSLVHAGRIEAYGPDAAAQLASQVREAGLAGKPCVFVLDPSAYAMRGLDAPEVPAEELRGAARWRVRELVDFDVEASAVDAIELCERDRRLWYVFVAPNHEVEACARIARQCGLDLHGVVTPEIAIGNLAARHPRAEEGVVLIAPREDAALLAIARGPTLYLTRWVDCGLDAIASLDLKDLDEQGPAAEAYESLRMDVQRSLDFYERELHQPPPAVLALLPFEGDPAGLVDALRYDVGLPVELLEVGLSGGGAPDSRSLSACGAAFGVAIDADDMRINLARELDEREPAKLSFRHVALAAAAALLLMAVLSGLRWVEVRSGSELLDDLERNLAHTEAAVSVLRQRVEGQRDPNRLQQVVDALRAELQSKQSLYELLTAGNMGNISGFSSVLEALSHASTNEVWLTGFKVQAGGEAITLEGRSYRAERVPPWADGVADQEAFQGKRFLSMRLEQAADLPGAVAFEVHNREQLP